MHLASCHIKVSSKSELKHTKVLELIPNKEVIKEKNHLMFETLFKLKIYLSGSHCLTQQFVSESPAEPSLLLKYCAFVV